MNKEEFLRELEEALAGDVPEAVIRDNVSYYGSYLSQELANGRTVDEVVAEIGEPFIVAKTIIESFEAAGGYTEQGGGAYDDPYGSAGTGGSGYGAGASGGYDGQYHDRGQSPFSGMHYIDLNKWYWKLAGIAILAFVMWLVFSIVGGMFALLIRFSGPLLMIFFVMWLIKRMR